jgi:hypothetical protein
LRLLLLFFPIFALANELYLLPDTSHQLLYDIEKDIQAMHETLYILTPSLQAYSLQKVIKQKSKRRQKGEHIYFQTKKGQWSLPVRLTSKL